MEFNKLFSVIKIRGLELKNRIIFPAMGTKMGTEDRFVTDRLIGYHAARAKGGTALNIVEVCSVYSKAAPKNFLSIAEDDKIEGLKKLTDAIHKEGGKASLQLWLGGTAVCSDQTAMAVIPSDITYPSGYVIKGATKEVIKECIEAFGKATKRSVEAGFDSIELHGGHNYTIHTFLSGGFNKRDDEYGGSLENRARFGLEVIKEIRKNMPEDMPLFMRIDAHDDNLENGLIIEDIIKFSLWAKEAGVDVLDVSRGNFSSSAIKYEVPPIDLKKGFNVDNAAKIKEATGMLTIAVGRINDPKQAEDILKDNKADMVVIGRAQLADAEFCNKSRDGQVDDIIRCVACNQGCYDGFVSTDVPFITCLRNPELGRELEYKLTKAEDKKKVLVIGGGVAGLEVAIELKDRGHEVVLCEATDSLGGQFALAGEAPRKGEMKDAALAMGEMAKKKGVEIRFSTKVTEDVIDEIKPDEVVIAVGSEPMKLNVKGLDLNYITNSHEVLAGKVKSYGKVVVVGGGLVGLEVAEYLSGSVDKVTVVEMQDKVAKDLGQLRKICVMESLYKEGIETVTNAKCTEIKAKSIVVDINGELKEIECDSIVIAIGSRSRDYSDLSKMCEDRKIKFHVIGDAVRARRALNSIQEAADVARII